MRQDDFDSSPVVMWYGKIPAMGDFVRRRMPEPILLPWERWFSSGVSQIRSPSKTAGAKNTIIYAIVGLIVALLANLIVRFVVGKV